MLEAATESGGMPRASLRIGGLSVARQQLALALALRCERVICIAASPTAELGEMQLAAETGRARFHLVANARALAGLITAADDVVVVADGLFASTAEAAALLDPGNVVLVQPIDAGLEAGFERIDLEHASGGAMRIPGRLVERLFELPADCDAASALLRIALQAGIAQRPIPPAGRDGLFWTLVRSDAEAHALEPQWIRQRTRDGAPPNLVRLVALQGVRAFAPALLHAGGGPGTLGIAAGVLALLGLGAGWFGHGVVGLCLCAIGALFQEGWRLVERIERDNPAPSVTNWPIETYDWILDIVLITLLVWNGTGLPPAPLYQAIYPPLVLIGLLRLVPRTLSGRWTAWLQDRMLLAAVLAVSVAAGSAHAMVYAAGIMMLVAGIALPSAESRLTRP